MARFPSLATLALACTLTTAAQARTWPTPPLEVVVVFPTGSMVSVDGRDSASLAFAPAAGGREGFDAGTGLRFCASAGTPVADASGHFGTHLRERQVIGD